MFVLIWCLLWVFGCCGTVCWLWGLLIVLFFSFNFCFSFIWMLNLVVYSGWLVVVIVVGYCLFFWFVWLSCYGLCFWVFGLLVWVWVCLFDCLFM